VVQHFRGAQVDRERLRVVGLGVVGEVDAALQVGVEAGGCRRSRGCSITESADGRFVVEATMGSLVVIEVGPGL